MRSLLLFSLCLGACTLDVERTEDAEDAEVSDADRDIVIDGPDSEPEPDAALPDLGIASEDDCVPEECPSGRCRESQEGRLVCAERCGNDEDCAPGLRCRQDVSQGPDLSYICVSDCVEDADGDGDPDCFDCRMLDPDSGHGKAEVCGDGIDNDCDGETDEGFELVDTECSVGEGACMAVGRWSCGEDGVVCDAVAGAPTEELCGTGADEDCDGEIDEGFEALGSECGAGVGACAEVGEWACDGARLRCTAAPEGGGVELCGNGVDDDCDGEVDEGFEALGAACSQGLGACAAEGSWACVDGAVACDAQGAAPRPERCDGVDDDCDGSVDEDFALGVACEVGVGACHDEGVSVCNAAQDAVECSAVAGAPSEEICNREDDDCDGLVDELEVALFDDPQNCGACGAVCEGRSPSCAGATCYENVWVDVGAGSDLEGQGTEAEPWRSIGHALASSEGALRVILHMQPGTYGPETEAWPYALRDGVQVVAEDDEVVLDGGGEAGFFELRGPTEEHNELRGLQLRNFADTAIYTEGASIALRGLRIGPAEVRGTHSIFDLRQSSTLVEDLEVKGVHTAGREHGAMRCLGGFLEISGANVDRSSVEGVNSPNGLLRLEDCVTHIENAAFCTNDGNVFGVRGVRAELDATHLSVAELDGHVVWHRDGALFFYNSVLSQISRWAFRVGDADFIEIWTVMVDQLEQGVASDGNVEVVQAVEADLLGALRDIKALEPQFMSVRDCNLHLREGSPAIDAGGALGLAVDRDGAARSGPPDLGAYEFQALPID